LSAGTSHRMGAATGAEAVSSQAGRAGRPPPPEPSTPIPLKTCEPHALTARGYSLPGTYAADCTGRLKMDANQSVG
jgi:hypothetical protein